MSRKTPQQEILENMARVSKVFQPGGDLAPIEDRGEYEKKLEDLPPQERELARELTRFTELWKYFSEHNQKLGEDIVGAIAALHRLPLAERVERVRDINQMLMQHLDHAGEGTQFRN